MATPKKIALFHAGNAYLPEIEIYQDFLQPHGFQIDVFTSKQKIALEDYDIEWHLMGIDLQPKVPGRLKIHEYISLSLPSFSKWKDRFKENFNTKPDLRIFHNERVKKELVFNDGIPFLFRDAGIGAHFFDAIEIKTPIYDFVYLGAMNATRQMHHLFHHYLKNFKSQTLLVIGDAPSSLLQAFQTPQIHFIGKIPYIKIPHYLRQARYGLNYIPVRRPYYLQPSLKLLEYCAVNLKIITTDYEWVNHFEHQKSARFFKINPNWQNFTWEAIHNFDFKTPDVRDLSWNNILQHSKILTFLQSSL